MASLSEIISYTDRFLRIREVGDWDNALNGLQIENSGGITRLGAAVDVSTRVLAEAAKKKVDLLIVHHGLFWAGLQPVTSAMRRGKTCWRVTASPGTSRTVQRFWKHWSAWRAGSTSGLSTH